VNVRVRQESQTQSEKAYLELRRMITDCELQPGISVSEPELTNRLKIQKAAVRAALLRLSQDGLVTSVPRQGHVVAPLTISDALDLIELRSLSEPRAAYLAAGNVEPSILEHALQHYERGFDRSNERSVRAYLRRNREFKIEVATASRNSRLAAWVADVSATFDRYLLLSLQDTSWRESPDVHGSALVRALKAGEREAAAKASRQAIRDAATGVIAALLRRESRTTWSLIQGHESPRKVIEELLGDRIPSA
jgi:DNA-binding GntR family transcriptional regulator